MNLEQLIFTWHFPVDTGRKLNVHKTFNLRPITTGLVLALFTSRLRLEPQKSTFWRQKTIRNNLRKIF